MDTLWQDIRYAARGLAKNAGFTAVLVTILALGIGANTAIFSLVDTLYLRPLPIRDPDRVVMVMGSRGAGMFSYPNFADYREHNGVFDGLVASRPLRTDVVIGDEQESVDGLLVSGDYFEILGVVPRLGRAFRTQDARPGAPPVALVSERLWKRRLGAAPDAIGRKLQLGGTDFTIVGIVASPFSVDAVSDPQIQVWVPLQPGLLGETAAYRNRDMNWLWMQGRLKAGVSHGQAQAAMDTLTARLAREHPMNEGVRVSVLSERQWRLRRRAGGEVVLLFLCAVGSVLLLACANVTNLMLVRAQARAREITVRAALGATRARIVRQLSTESVLLAGLGGAAGWLVGHWALAGIRAMTSASVPLPEGVALDGRALAFTAAVSLVTAILCGLAPALHTLRADLASAMKTGGWIGLGRAGRLPLMKSLVVGQVALALVLLVSTGLFLRTAQLIWDVDLGFRTEKLVWTRLDLRALRYDETRSRIVFADAVERVRSHAGVAAAGIGPAPLAGYPWTNVVVDGTRDPRETYFTKAGPGYFATLGVRVAGRDFDATDTAGAPPVVIVNETLARRFWPDTNAVGQRLKPWADGPAREIIGVVPDMRSSHWRPADPLLYLPISQSFEARAWIVARAGEDPRALRDAIHRLLVEVEPLGALSPVTTFDQALANQIAEIRFTAKVLGVLGAVGLMLAGLGLYGLMSFAVSRSVRGIGVRIALGASADAVQRLILGHAMRLIGAGLIAGAGLSLAAARLLQTVIVGSPRDPGTFTAVAALLLATGLLAAYFPARRAGRIDPVAALRHE